MPCLQPGTRPHRQRTLRLLHSKATTRNTWNGKAMNDETNVIRPDPGYWTRPKENPMMLTREESEAALCWLAVIEAASRYDQHAANVLLEPWRDNLGPVLKYALLMTTSLIGGGVDRPDMFINYLRGRLITDMANGDAE